MLEGKFSLISHRKSGKTHNVVSFLWNTFNVKIQNFQIYSSKCHNNKPFLIFTSALRALAGGRGTPLSGSCIILTRTSIVISLSVRDDTLALSRPPGPPPSRAARRGSTGAFFFFFFSLTFVWRAVELPCLPLCFNCVSLFPLESSTEDRLRINYLIEVGSNARLG